MPNTFILSDESINSYGFRVLTSGINLERFRKNPVLFYGHRTWSMPIGRWENIRVEDGKLLADAVFDESKLDEQAEKVKAKVEQGILNCCSIGFRVVETSEAPEYLRPGQTRPTVTKAELIECSIVAVAANQNAVKLTFEERGLTLSDNAPSEFLSSVLPKINSSMSTKMKLLTLMLGLLQLDDNATEEDVRERIEELKRPDEEKEKMLADALIRMGKSQGKINDENEKHYRKLAAADLESCLALIEQTPNQNAGQKTLNEHLRENQQKNAGHKSDKDRDSWSLEDWSEKDEEGLLKLKRESPEQYEALAEDYYKRKRK